MFDTVARAKFDQEQERRITAEQRVASLDVVVQSLTTQIENMGELLRRQAELFHDLEIDRRDRSEPKQTALRSSLNEESPEVSAAQVRSQPAATRQEMVRREKLAQEIEKREKERADKAHTATAAAALDQRSLPPDERVRVREIAASLQ